MIHRHVLAALATGIEAGNDDAAREAVLRADWILRGAARRRLERALIDAALVSRELVSAADAEGMRHVQRVAALDLAGRDVDASDRDAVARAYHGLDVRAPAAPVATIAAGVLAVVAVVAFGLGVHRLRHPHRSHPSPPPAVGAYAHGGTPAYDPTLDHILGDELATYLVARDEGRLTPPAGLRDALAYPAWPALVDALEHFDRKHPERLRQAARALSDQLAAQGLGYHLEGDVFVDGAGAHAIVFSYRVEQVVFVRADGEPRRVLDLRRLDHINLSRSVLGLEQEEGADPEVLLDQIESFVESHVHPVLAGAAYPLGDGAFRQTTEGARLAVAAGDAIRPELSEPLAPLVAATVRRHEARHALDVERDEPLRVPPALATYVGSDGPFASRARAELAAYLTQIAYDPHTPQLALWNLANQAFRHDRFGSAEFYAAVIAVEGLARHAGGGIQPPALAHGRMDRGRLATTAMPLAHVSDDALRVAARELFAELFAEPPVAIYDSQAAP